MLFADCFRGLNDVSPIVTTMNGNGEIVMKRYLRRAAVAERYQVDVRTVPRMVKDGRLRPPDLFNGRMPLWSEAGLDADDTAAALRPRPQPRDGAGAGRAAKRRGVAEATG